MIIGRASGSLFSHDTEAISIFSFPTSGVNFVDDIATAAFTTSLSESPCAFIT